MAIVSKAYLEENDCLYQLDRGAMTAARTIIYTDCTGEDVGAAAPGTWRDYSSHQNVFFDDSDMYEKLSHSPDAKRCNIKNKKLRQFPFGEDVKPETPPPPENYYKEEPSAENSGEEEPSGFVYSVEFEDLRPSEGVYLVYDYASGNIIKYNSLDPEELEKSSRIGIVFPEGIKEIKDEELKGMTNLIKVKIPSGVTKIGYRAFYDCKYLSEVSLPDTLKEICGEAFKNSGICELTVPKNTVKIGDKAFSNCEYLKSVEFSGAETELGSGAFEYCTKLESVKTADSKLIFGPDTFAACIKLEKNGIYSVPYQKKIYASAISGNRKQKKYTRYMKRHNSQMRGGVPYEGEKNPFVGKILPIVIFLAADVILALKLLNNTADAIPFKTIFIFHAIYSAAVFSLYFLLRLRHRRSSFLSDIYYLTYNVGSVRNLIVTTFKLYRINLPIEIAGQFVICLLIKHIAFEPLSAAMLAAVPLIALIAGIIAGLIISKIICGIIRRKVESALNI